MLGCAIRLQITTSLQNNFGGHCQTEPPKGDGKRWIGYLCNPPYVILFVHT